MSNKRISRWIDIIGKERPRVQNEIKEAIIYPTYCLNGMDMGRSKQVMKIGFLELFRGAHEKQKERL